MSAAVGVLRFVKGRAGLALFLLCLAAFPARADMILLKDGTLLLGEIRESAAGKRSVLSRSGTVEVSDADIELLDPPVADLSGRLFDVTLADGKKMTGEIVDFEEEIGLFLKLPTGTVKVAIEDLVSVREPKNTEKTRYRLSFGLSAQAPLNSAFLKAQYGALAGVETGIASLSPIFFGVRAGYQFLQNAESDKILVHAVSVTPYVGVLLPKIGVLRSWPLAQPYALAGAGIAGVFVRDGRDSAANKNLGSANGTFWCEAGNRFWVNNGWGLSASVTGSGIMQSKKPALGLGGIVSYIVRR